MITRCDKCRSLVEIRGNKLKPFLSKAVKILVESMLTSYTDNQIEKYYKQRVKSQNTKKVRKILIDILKRHANYRLYKSIEHVFMSHAEEIVEDIFKECDVYESYVKGGNFGKKRKK